MASADSVEDQNFLSHVERVRCEMKTKFQKAHKVLLDREEELLNTLKRLVDEYTGDGMTDQIRQLSDSKDALMTSLKGNENTEILNQSLAPINARIREFENRLLTAKDTYKSVSLEWDVELERKLSVAGDIRLNVVKGIRDYKEIGEPVVAFGKHSEEGSLPCVFCYPNDIAINPVNNNIYICDSGNNRVQVYDKSGEYLYLFDEKMNGPSGVCISHNQIYVTQYYSHCLNVYSTETKFQKSVGSKGDKWLEFNKPRALAISTERNKVYIAEFDNNRVQCLNLDLTFLSIISNIYGAMDVKLTSEEVVILSSNNPCVFIYSYTNQLIRRMVPWGESQPLISPSRMFVTDLLNTILITDNDAHCVCVFSCEGEFLHKFGKSGVNRGEFIQPSGLSIDTQSRILVVSENPDQCIQIFISQY